VHGMRCAGIGHVGVAGIGERGWDMCREGNCRVSYSGMWGCYRDWRIRRWDFVRWGRGCPFWQEVVECNCASEPSVIGD
jgi:hypothetical protein